jgi:acetyltransferase
MGGRRAEAEERVVLKDGSEVFVRPVRPEDKDLLTELVAGLGEESRYRRFMSPITQLPDRKLAQFTELDHHDSEALGAEGRRCLGVSRYTGRIGTDQRVAEVATVVADAWQRRGLARVLVKLLIERARAEGIERLVALIGKRNRQALRLFEKQLGFGRRGIESGMVEMHMDL